MNHLTVEQVAFLHARLIEETGGSHGIRDVGLLQSAVARSWTTFDGQDLYGEVFSKAAALMHSLTKNHPFVDGNKRTGTAAAVLLLRTNGWSFEASNAELEEFALRVVGEELAVLEMAEWLRRHSVRRRS
jgi:death-on-curing protein